MLAASGGSDRRIFELAAGMERRSVVDLIHRRCPGHDNAADAADRQGRNRGLDRSRSGGARQAHRRTRSDRHCAAGLDADLLPFPPGGCAATDCIEVSGGDSSGEVESC
jgi:hypothetical protein